MSPLLLPGVRGPAICSALKFRIVSMVCRPMLSITSSTASRACVISSTSGKQNLAVRFRELFHAGGCCFSFPVHDMVRFLHGAGVLSRIVFGESILTNRAATAAFQPSTARGTRSSSAMRPSYASPGDQTRSLQRFLHSGVAQFGAIFLPQLFVRI